MMDCGYEPEKSKICILRQKIKQILGPSKFRP